jgi:hypothetical protein
MHENVVAAIIWSDEAEALLAIVELNGTGIHIAILPSFFAARIYKNPPVRVVQPKVHYVEIWRESERTPGSAKRNSQSSGQSRGLNLVINNSFDKTNLQNIQRLVPTELINTKETTIESMGYDVGWCSLVFQLGHPGL